MDTALAVVAVVAFAAAALQLRATVRLRRRGLMEPDPRAAWLAGLTFIQVVLWATSKGQAVAAMAAAGLPMLVLTALSSRRLLPARAHARLWGAIAAVTVGALVVAALAK